MALRQIERHNEVKEGQYLVKVTVEDKETVYLMEDGVDSDNFAIGMWWVIVNNIVSDLHLSPCKVLLTRYDSPLRQKKIREVEIS